MAWIFCRCSAESNFTCAVAAVLCNRQPPHVPGTCTVLATSDARMSQLKSPTDPHCCSNKPTLSNKVPPNQQLRDGPINRLARQVQQAVMRSQPQMRVAHQLQRTFANTSASNQSVRISCPVSSMVFNMQCARFSASGWASMAATSFSQAVRRHRLVAGRDLRVSTGPRQMSWIPTPGCAFPRPLRYPHPRFRRRLLLDVSHAPSSERLS